MLEKDTYPFPKKEALKHTMSRLAAAYILGLAGIIASIWVGVEYGSSREFWGTFVPTLMVLAISGWGTYWFMWRYPMAKAKIDGVNLVFRDKHYYVPPEVFKAEVLDPLYESFRPHIDFDPKRLVIGATVILLPHKPRERGERIGVTTPAMKMTQVYAPYVLNRGAAGYELRLICCHQLFPGRSEGDDIKWMKEKSIL